LDDRKALFRTDDILAVSFPKSGNTWVRMIYANIMRELYGLEEINLVNLNDLLPEYIFRLQTTHENLRNMRWTYDVPRLVKTHERYIPDFENLRCIFIVRNPKDVMISYYHYEKAKIQSYPGDLTAFIRDSRFGIEAWIRHTESWLTNRHHLSAIEIFRYEEMKETPASHVKIILDLMGARLSDEQIDRVIERSSFEHTRRMEEKYGLGRYNEFHDSFRFTRDGSVNQWIREMNEEQIRYIDEMIAGNRLVSEFLGGVY